MLMWKSVSKWRPARVAGKPILTCYQRDSPPRLSLTTIAIN